MSRSLISEYPGYSLISEPIIAREKHYSLVGYMLTVDSYFLLSNQSARKALSTCLANTKTFYPSLQDNCPRHSNPVQTNSDSDIFGDVCDNCPYASNALQSDMDEDDEGDICDNDIDGDGTSHI